MLTSLFKCLLCFEKECFDRAVIFKPHKVVPETPQGIFVPELDFFGGQEDHKVEVMILATVADPGAALQKTILHIFSLVPAVHSQFGCFQ